MTIEMAEMVEGVKAHAVQPKNYEKGWDIIVETYDDAMIEERLTTPFEGRWKAKTGEMKSCTVGTPRSIRGAIDKIGWSIVAPRLDAMKEHAAEVAASGVDEVEIDLTAAAAEEPAKPAKPAPKRSRKAKAEVAA